MHGVVVYLGTLSKVLAPGMRITSVSPRNTAPCQMLTCSPNATLPITCALSAIQADAGILGLTPSSEYTAIGFSFA